jgi:hypothetical protein
MFKFWVSDSPLMKHFISISVPSFKQFFDLRSLCALKFCVLNMNLTLKTRLHGKIYIPFFPKVKSNLTFIPYSTRII